MQSLIMVAILCKQMPNAHDRVIKISYGAVNTLILKQQRITVQ